MGGKGSRRPTIGDAPPPVAVAEDLPERWSAARKTELVLRLLRGEPLDGVSRESQVPVPELESWKRVFLEAGPRGLKSRADPEARELTLARAKSGELMMRLEPAEHLIETRGFADEWDEARGMKGAVSPSTGRPDPLTMLCTTFRVPRSSRRGDHPVATPPAGEVGAEGHGRRDRRGGPRRPGRESFRGEGERKVWAGSHTRAARSVARVSCGSCASRCGWPRGSWGRPMGIPPTSAGSAPTPRTCCGGRTPRASTRSGRAGLGSSAPSTTNELLDRWAALAPIRHGVCHAFGDFRKDVARGGARVHRRHGALHPDAHGAVPLPAAVPDPGGGGARDHRGLHPAVQHGVARAAEGRGMTWRPVGGPGEGHTGSRIAFEHPGYIAVPPRIDPNRASHCPRNQGTNGPPPGAVRNPRPQGLALSGGTE